MRKGIGLRSLRRFPNKAPSLEMHRWWWKQFSGRVLVRAFRKKTIGH